MVRFLGMMGRDVRLCADTGERRSRPISCRHLQFSLDRHCRTAGLLWLLRLLLEQAEHSVAVAPAGSCYFFGNTKVVFSTTFYRRRRRSESTILASDGMDGMWLTMSSQ